MKNSNKFRLVAVILLMALTNYLCGCSVVGLGVGAAIDNKRSDYKTMESDQLQFIDPGTDVTLHLNDGSTRHGIYSGNTTEKLKDDANSGIDTTLTLNERMLIIQTPHIPEGSRKIEYIPLNSISLIEIKNVKEAKHLGFMTGLIIDIVLVYWLSSIEIYLPM